MKLSVGAVYSKTLHCLEWGGEGDLGGGEAPSISRQHAERNGVAAITLGQLIERLRHALPLAALISIDA